MRLMALLEDETYFNLVRSLYKWILKSLRALLARFPLLKGYLFATKAWIKRSYRTPEFWLTFLAYAIPLSFLLYVLYWNFLPFGYNKTFVIDVGAEGDTKGEFYLEPSESLSERKVAEDGTTYRELNGLAYAVFKPKAVLKDAEITVEVEGEGVSIIPPYIDFDPDSVEWDYSWDFTEGKQPEELGLVGDAFPFDGCMYFDGKSKLELPDSADKFEDGPFTVYAEWTPEDSTKDFQQIVGHYNWELLQNKDSVTFQVGRMNTLEGYIYNIEFPISADFFLKRHSLIATYSPSSNGYIELYIDNTLIKRVGIGNNVISREYGERDTSFGKATHGAATFFNGCINSIKIHSAVIPFLFFEGKIHYKNTKRNVFYISINSESPSSLDSISMEVLER